MTDDLTVHCEADIPYYTTEVVPRRCVIYDGRKADLDFHRNGFELRHLPSAVVDWTDEAEIQRLEYPAGLSSTAGYTTWAIISASSPGSSSLNGARSSSRICSSDLGSRTSSS